MVILDNFVTSGQASGAVVIPLRLNLVSPEEGYAEKLFVKEGDQVAYWQLLAKINVPDLEDQLKDLESDLENA